MCVCMCVCVRLPSSESLSARTERVQGARARALLTNFYVYRLKKEKKRREERRSAREEGRARAILLAA